MEFPEFHEFMETLTDERIVEMLNDIPKLEVFQIQDIHDERNISRFVSELMMNYLSYATKMNVQILFAYHQWLKERLG